MCVERMCVQSVISQRYFQNRHHSWPSRIYFYVTSFLPLFLKFFSAKMFLLQRYIYSGGLKIWEDFNGL